MKKIISFAVGVLGLFVLFGNGVPASAMTVSDPEGTVINGWYKDSFTVDIRYGDPWCVSEGTHHQHTFRAGKDFDGVHNYLFLGDHVDNPYLSLDGSSPQQLVNPLKCPVSWTFFKPNEDLGEISLDAIPPSASITSPAGSASTSDSSYTISGTVNDSASGVASVQAVINSQLGPIASINGNTFSIVIPLKEGTNSIHVVAKDNVDHSSTSNTISIARSSSTSNSTGSTSPTPSSPSSPAPSTNNPSPSPQQQPRPPSPSTNSTPLRFNQRDILSIESINEDVSDPQQVLISQGLAGAQGKTYYSLIILVLLLLGLAILVIWRFMPIFKKLDKSNSGLRRRIIIIVVLPSLIPLFGLGFLGYQQLTTIVKGSLSDQLAKAAQTSSLKLEREFSMRSTVISKTGDGIFQVKFQINQRKDRLRQQRDDCNNLVRTLIPRYKYSEITSNDACLPFLSGFAQLARPTAGSRVEDYLNAVNAGYEHALKTSDVEQQQRIDELLGSTRHFFPELLELVIVDTSKTPTTVAILPQNSQDAVSLITSHPDLLKQARDGSFAVLDDTTEPRQLLVTYPIVNNKKEITGGAIAKFNMEDSRFIHGIWQSTPKPSTNDSVFFLNSEGEIMYPAQSIRANKKDLKRLAESPPAKTTETTINDQELIMRAKPVSNTNWSVAVASPAESVLAPLAGIQRTALLTIAAFILISVFLGFIFVTGIAKEIERLLTGAIAFAKGNLDYRIGLTSRDELQSLGDTMDKMASDIKEAQDALIEKDKEFINVATHELRAPMTGIIGNLSMITEDGMGQVDDTARNLINKAYSGTIRLRELVNDMLDVARLEAGREEFKLEPLSIADLSKSIVGMQEAAAQQNSITLQGPGDNALPRVIADKNKLQIIITNFISNAIKYNRSGGSVTIQHQLDGNRVVTSVTDTGLGIPEDQQNHIFEKFYRVSGEDRANITGTGLGLHITKRFIEAMDGKAWFESVQGQGTTFFFSLPIETEAVEEPTNTKPSK